MYVIYSANEAASGISTTGCPNEGLWCVEKKCWANFENATLFLNERKDYILPKSIGDDARFIEHSEILKLHIHRKTREEY